MLIYKIIRELINKKQKNYYIRKKFYEKNLSFNN